MQQRKQKEQEAIGERPLVAICSCCRCLVVLFVFIYPARARAVTGRRRLRKTFWCVGQFFFYKNDATRKLKVEKSIPRSEKDPRSDKDYKRTIDKIWGPGAKNISLLADLGCSFKKNGFWAKKTLFGQT